MKKKHLLALVLALSLVLGLTGPALAAETAAVIRLTKTTGTVAISKSGGKSVSLLKNMRLYNDYRVSTEEDSYAWINLDDSRLLKEDAESAVEVRKYGKNLSVQLVEGGVFFDVATPLEDDESLNIRTSTTAVGIRGTSGYIQAVDERTTRVFILEGTVRCTVKDPDSGETRSEKVTGGETVLCVAYPKDKAGAKTDIIREKFTVKDIPYFILSHLVQNPALRDKIQSESGLAFPRELSVLSREETESKGEAAPEKRPAASDEKPAEKPAE